VTHLVSTRPPSIRIILGRTGVDCVVEVDGVRLPGVRGVSVSGDVGSITRVNLELIAKDGVEIETQAGLLAASVVTHGELLDGTPPGTRADVTTFDHANQVEAVKR
jgi:hypothetical protein